MATARKPVTSEADLKAMEVQRRRDLSRTEGYLSDDTLRSIGSYEDALKLMTELYGSVKDLEEFEIGTGFKAIPKEQKTMLVGVPFIILAFRFNEGDFGDGEFVSIMLVTGKGDRLVLNDGSTGVYSQIVDIARTGRFGGISVPKGLRASEYPTCPGCDRPRLKSATVCTNMLNNGTECGNTEERRGLGATYYLDV